MDTGELYSLDAYIQLADQYLPRMLSQIDRDPDSPTYGSADRGFWMYRLHDFDSGVVQQASLTLAALAELAEKIDLSETKYLKTEHAPYWRELARAVNQRNLKLLAKTGMVDEYYPGEQSFPGTVFMIYATLKSALMMGQTEVIESAALRKTAERFLKRTPSPAANQDTAAAAFLALYSRSLNWRKEEASQIVEDLILRPAQGGKFWEYGGLDVGYSTVSLNYLGYMVADGTEFVKTQMLALAKVITKFVTPGGNLGGEFAARSTTYFLPFGLLMAAGLDGELAGRFASLNLASAYARLDDRYLIHYCLPSLAMSALFGAQNGFPVGRGDSFGQDWESAYSQEFATYWAVNDRAAVFVGLNKGGAYQVEVDGETIMDCGYRLGRGGQVYATCVLDDLPEVEYQEDGGKVMLKVKAPFKRYGILTPSSIKTIILRLIGMFGPRLNDIFKNILIKKPRLLADTWLERTIIVDLEKDVLMVNDRFEGLKHTDRLTISPASSFRLVPSAKFYQPGEAEVFLRMAEAGGLDVSQTDFKRELSLR